MFFHRQLKVSEIPYSQKYYQHYNLFLELKQSFKFSLRCASPYNIAEVNVWLNVGFVELYPMIFTKESFCF